MRKLTEQYQKLSVTVRASILLGIATTFLASGFALLFVYQFTMVRHCIGAATALIIIVKREQIMTGIRALLQMKTEQ